MCVMEWIKLTNECIVKIIIKRHVITQKFYTDACIGVICYHKETRIQEYSCAAWTIGLSKPQKEGRDYHVRLLPVGSQICPQLPAGLCHLVLGLRAGIDWGFGTALTETEYWGKVLCFRVTGCL